MDIVDNFKGNNEKLRSCIVALLRLDDAGALKPCGIGVHAHALLSSSHVRLAQVEAERDALQQLLNARDEELSVLRQIVVDIRHCNFQGRNPDGSSPLVLIERPDGSKQMIGIRLHGWHCQGPAPEPRHKEDDYEVGMFVTEKKS